MIQLLLEDNLRLPLTHDNLADHLWVIISILNSFADYDLLSLSTVAFLTLNLCGLL